MGGPYDETGFGLNIDLTTYGLRLAAVDLLFSESHGRAVITCPPTRTTAVAALAQELGVPAQRLGTVAERGGAVRLRLRDATVEHVENHREDEEHGGAVDVVFAAARGEANGVEPAEDAGERDDVRKEEE